MADAHHVVREKLVEGVDRRVQVAGRCVSSVVDATLEGVTMLAVRIVDRPPARFELFDFRRFRVARRMQRRRLAENQVDLGQLHPVLVGTIVEAVVTIVVVDTGRLGEPVEKTRRNEIVRVRERGDLPEEILETISMQVIFTDGQDDSINGGKGDLGGDAERRVRIDEGHQFDATPFADLLNECAQALRDRTPRIAVRRERV